MNQIGAQAKILLGNVRTQIDGKAKIDRTIAFQTGMVEFQPLDGYFGSVCAATKW